ncbi:MAG: LysR family transcriptional regulator [Deltaproteobacteria bacterium]|jgi:DNA-binding transcriptional LysR family regulator|nr:LysR family transcriptional regulator [Deltaproteobacteria bacterium]
MDLPTLAVFRTVAAEKSFSRAAVKLARTQPAVSLAVQRLEHALGEPLIDRSGRHLRLTDAGQIVFDHARRFENLRAALLQALAELRDKATGRLLIGANESATLYLLPLLSHYRRRYPRVKVQVRRCQSSKIPTEILEGDLELGVISYDPNDGRLASRIIYTDHLACVVSPRHRLARRRSVSITDLGMETFIGHIVISPYKEVVMREFERFKVPLNRDLEMPTVEAIRKMVQRNEGISFLPRMCVEEEIAQGTLREIQVKGLQAERKIRLVHPAGRTLSHAARAFLALL